MLARIYALLFLGILGFSIWFQQNYMRLYSLEMEALTGYSRTQMELMQVKPVNGTQYRNNMPQHRVTAQNGTYFTSGKLVFSGDVRYLDIGPDGNPQASLHSMKALAQVQTLNDGASFLDGARTFETLEMPGPVTARLEEDVINTKNVKMNVHQGVLETKEAVTVKGPNRELEGVGLRYAHPTGELSLGGPVRGTLVPTPSPRRRNP